jgi:hypothetical protein
MKVSQKFLSRRELLRAGLRPPRKNDRAAFFVQTFKPPNGVPRQRLKPRAAFIV